MIKFSAVALSVLLLASCGSSLRKEFVSPSGSLVLSFERGHGSIPGGYVLHSKNGSELAKVQTIIQDDFSTDPSLPHEQRVLWSPSEHSIVIHEDMTDALPYSITFLLQEDPAVKSWTVSIADLGKRLPGANEDPVWGGDSPTPESLTDSELKVFWFKDKSHGNLPLSGLKLSDGRGAIPRP